MSTEETLKKVESEIENLKDDLKLCTEAKSRSEACNFLCEYSEQEEEPFSVSHQEPNSWHNNPGGGGFCIIL